MSNNGTVKEILYSGIINPGNYGFTQQQVIPFYVYADVLHSIGFSLDGHRHFRVNNEFVRKYVSRFYGDISFNSVWQSPATVKEGAMLIGAMAGVVVKDQYGEMLVTMADSTEMALYGICDEGLLYSIALFDDVFSKNAIFVQICVNDGGDNKILFVSFYSNNANIRSQISAIHGSVAFADCNLAISYSAVPCDVYKVFSKISYAEKFFRNKEVLADYISCLANYPVVTSGLEVLNRRTVSLFNQLYLGNHDKTLAERKLFFRELGAATGSVSATQKGSSFLLQKLKAVCGTLDIKFWLYYGTLLGAKRHGAFIPWDDDIDVGIMRDDLTRLQEYLKDDEYFTVDVLYNTEWADRVYKFRFKNEDLPAYVDLFPFDYCKGRPENIWNNLKKLKSEMVKRFREYEKESGNVLHKCFNVPEAILNEVNELFDFFGKKAESVLGLAKKDAGMIVYGYDTAFLIDWLQVFRTDDIAPFAEESFNGVNYNVFKNADEVLDGCYTAPYTLPDDIISHRHTARLPQNKQERLFQLIEELKDYEFKR